MAVNVSPRQLDDDALPGRVRAALREHGLEPASLVLELAESVRLEEDGDALARLRELKALGVGIALDARAAMGWSSGRRAAGPPRLGELPVDTLKLDRSFAAGLGAQPEAGGIVTAVLGLARSLGLDVVAEGIEDEEAAETLAALGCETGQGHAFSPAAPAGVVGELLARGCRGSPARDARGRPARGRGRRGRGCGGGSRVRRRAITRSPPAARRGRAGPRRPRAPSRARPPSPPPSPGSRA
jgi:EAL domain-containing protein (putative c-di-GMP-specific phosphodiesterase class I)